ncbi:hypothetical protein JCM3766R1_001364 [Sporobolomyces carnicolor]
MASIPQATPTLSVSHTGSRQNIARNFAPLKGIKWTAQTSSNAMKQLVQQREEIFAAHRRLANDGRAIREANAIALDACTPMQDSSMQCLAQRYAEFCTMVKIPRLPISQSTLALFHVAKCSHRDGYYQSTVRMMRRMIDEGESMWRNERGYADLNGPRAWVATREFMAERSHLRLRGASTAQKRKVDDEDEDPEPPSDSDEDIDELGSGDDRKQRSPVRGNPGPAVKQMTIPNLPRPGQVFDSPKALFLACYLALLPVYGYGAMQDERHIACMRSSYNYRDVPHGPCKWKVSFRVNASGQCVVADASQSNLHHNHGPRPEIVRDPRWRPVIRHADVRRALGMPAIKPHPLHKKPKHDDDAEREAEDHGDARAVPISSTRPHIPSPIRRPVALSSSRSPEVVRAPTTRPFTAMSAPRPPPPRYPPTLVDKTTRTPHLAPNGPAPPSFLKDLQSFLVAIDPTLARLAEPMSKIGITSIELVAQLCTFERRTLENLSRTAMQQSPHGHADEGRVLFQTFIDKVVDARMRESWPA